MEYVCKPSGQVGGVREMKRFFLIASQTRREELQKVNIMRLNKASNLFSEALLIGSV